MKNFMITALSIFFLCSVVHAYEQSQEQHLYNTKNQEESAYVGSMTPAQEMYHEGRLNSSNTADAYRNRDNNTGYYNNTARSEYDTGNPNYSNYNK